MSNIYEIELLTLRSTVHGKKHVSGPALNA